jgi:hypothetical protein
MMTSIMLTVPSSASPSPPLAATLPRPVGGHAGAGARREREKANSFGRPLGGMRVMLLAAAVVGGPPHGQGRK